MGRRGAIVRTIVGWIGLVLFLIPLYFFIASGLLAPLWAIIGLLVVWAATLASAIRIRRRRPWLVLLCPMLLMLLWVVVITIGERVLGWTA